MTREEVREKLNRIVAEQQGRDFVEEQPSAKDLQEAFGVTSLDVVAIQVSMEETFGLKFATGGHDRGPIDKFWDEATGMNDLVDLVLRFRC